MAAKDVAPAVTLSNGHHGGGMPAATKLSNGHSMKTVPAVTLSSGHRMPAVGLGVWRMEKTAMRGIIHAAIRKGYRHFDCAGMHAPVLIVRTCRIQQSMCVLIYRLLMQAGH